MKELLHWGPILGLSMVNFVIGTTLYFLFQWQFPLYNFPSFLNYFVYTSLAICALYHYFSAIIIGPGIIRKGWKPKKKEDERFLQYCHKCEGFKAPRSHHCSKCGRCVMKMDHHCPWLNNCVGHANQRHFVYFLLTAVIGSFQTFFILGMTLYRAIFDIPNLNHRYIYLSFNGFLCIVVSIGLCVGVIIGVGALLCLQLKIAFKNQTSIEDWIVSKAEKRDRKEAFVYPYHLGYWNNLKSVFWYPLGDGIEWQVAEGCNQFTLTIEQLEQKRIKRENSQLCRVVEPYNGSYLPLFSKGWRTCISYPFNFDSRLPVEEGEDVLVTNWHKSWLFGHRMSDPPSNRRKGWFPHSCVVLLVEPHDCPANNKKNR